MNKYENFLKLEVVWKDEYMLELEVTVSNNGYSGIGRGYDTGESLENLAKQLEGFPKDDQPILYTIEESSRAGDLSISFCPIRYSGLIGVKVHLQMEGSKDCKNSTVSLELPVEPNAIDIFQKYLTALAANQDGTAKLVAR